MDALLKEADEITADVLGPGAQPPAPAPAPAPVRLPTPIDPIPTSESTRSRRQLDPESEPPAAPPRAPPTVARGPAALDDVSSHGSDATEPGDERETAAERARREAAERVRQEIDTDASFDDAEFRRIAAQQRAGFTSSSGRSLLGANPTVSPVAGPVESARLQYSKSVPNANANANANGLAAWPEDEEDETPPPPPPLRHVRSAKNSGLPGPTMPGSAPSSATGSISGVAGPRKMGAASNGRVPNPGRVRLCF